MALLEWYIEYLRRVLSELEAIQSVHRQRCAEVIKRYDGDNKEADYLIRRERVLVMQSLNKTLRDNTKLYSERKKDLFIDDDSWDRLAELIKEGKA